MLRKKSMDRKVVSRRGSVMLAIGVVAGLASMPTAAQAGFFDQLFGGFQAPAAAPIEASPSYNGAVDVAPRSHIHRVVRIAPVDSKPVLQKTTDLMHDKTLRAGDAVMMKDGIHVYAGRDGDRHNKGEFVTLDDARHVASKARVELAGLDVTRNDPLAVGNAPDTIASGRSASVGTPTVAGYRITDVKGASVRYVGP